MVDASIIEQLNIHISDNATKEGAIVSPHYSQILSRGDQVKVHAQSQSQLFLSVIDSMKSLKSKK